MSATLFLSVNDLHSHLRHRSLSALFSLVCVFLSNPAWAEPALVLAKPRTITTRLSAFAQVTPIALTRVRAADSGILASLTILPGQRVRAGATLGRLRGPEITAMLARLHSRVANERAAVRAARQALSAERRLFHSHLATRKALYQAMATFSQVKENLRSARSALDAARAATRLSAPVTGRVVSVNASTGERVQTNQILLTLQPAGSLWLQAFYYQSASNAIHLGMQGRFVPANGAAPMPVTVVSIGPAVRADGGLPVRLRASSSRIRWHSGEAGTVTLRGKTRQVVVIPTRALVLDHGRWWVLVHTRKGIRRRQVTPGPSRGFFTAIEKGLVPGERVVASNTYLRFHHSFSQRYQPPD